MSETLFIRGRKDDLCVKAVEKKRKVLNVFPFGGGERRAIAERSTVQWAAAVGETTRRQLRYLLLSRSIKQDSINLFIEEHKGQVFVNFS